MRVTASQAVDIRRQFLAYWTSEDGRAMLAAACASPTEAQETLDVIIATAGPGWAELVVVAADLVDLVDGAAPSMPVDFIPKSAQPFPCGMVLLEKPLDRHGLDSAGKVAPVWPAVMLWVTLETNMVVVYWFGAPCQWTDAQRNHLSNVIGISVATLESFPPFLLHSWSTFALGVAMTLDPVDTGMLSGHGIVPDLDADSVLRWTYALWSIMREPYVLDAEAMPDRHAAKRNRRSGYSDRPIREIRLRRAASRQHQQVTQARLTHRFVVRGHWRNQACGPNRAEHRMRWIMPYVKGPDDGEWMSSEKLYRLER